MEYDMRPTSSVLKLVVLGFSSVWPCAAAQSTEGKALLERNCGRCHALTPEVLSPLKEAPNLWIVLRSYPEERLEFELSEGIGSRHKEMPQVQFTSEEITAIQNYLSGEIN
jgi:mono/diheme cytochrome c family protein